MVRYHTEHTLIEKIKTENGVHRCVLLAHGEEAALSPLSEKLTGAGYRVYRAQNGDAALDMIHQSRPDAVITELNLKGVDGLNILSWVRRHYKQTAVFFTHSQIGKGETRRMFASQADGFFLPPLIEELDEDLGDLVLDSLTRFFRKRPQSSLSL